MSARGRSRDVLRKRLPRLALAAFALAIAPAIAMGACSSAATLTCPTSASAGGCPSLDGVTSFCTWTEWGCARVPACGGYSILVDQGTDARFTYYYAAATGGFVATVREDPGGGNASCLAGPAQFQPPQDCREDTLADCDPPPRDGGSVSALDAAADAPFTAPSPSGSPSSQPLVVPPRTPGEPHPPR